MPDNNPNPAPTNQPTLGTLWGDFNDTPPSPIEAPKPPEGAPVTPPAAPAVPAPVTPATPTPANPPAPAAPNPNPEPTKPGEEKPGEEKKPEDPPEDEEDADENEEGDDDPMAFWNDVNKLRGKDLKVDLSTFEDPTSPEAYMAVEKAVREEAMLIYDEYIEKTDPRAYSYFLHRRAGGSDADFFSQASDQLPTYDEFKGNVDLQKQVLTSALKAKGVSEKVISITITEAEKEGTLFKDADVEYQSRLTADQKLLDKIKQENDRRDQAYQTEVSAYEAAIDEVVFKGKTERIVIPEAKKNEFANFLKGKLTYDETTGNFILGQKVTKETIGPALEALYFQFSGGDIQKLVTAATRTAVSRRLGSQVQRAKAKADSAQNKDNNAPVGQTLSDIWQ